MALPHCVPMKPLPPFPPYLLALTALALAALALTAHAFAALAFDNLIAAITALATLATLTALATLTLAARPANRDAPAQAGRALRPRGGGDSSDHGKGGRADDLLLLSASAVRACQSDDGHGEQSKMSFRMTCSYSQHLLFELVKATTAMASSPRCRSGELHFTSTHKETRYKHAK